MKQASGVPLESQEKELNQALMAEQEDADGFLSGDSPAKRFGLT